MILEIDTSQIIRRPRPDETFDQLWSDQARKNAIQYFGWVRDLLFLDALAQPENYDEDGFQRFELHWPELAVVPYADDDKLCWVLGRWSSGDLWADFGLVPERDGSATIEVFM